MWLFNCPCYESRKHIKDSNPIKKANPTGHQGQTNLLWWAITKRGYRIYQVLMQKAALVQYFEQKNHISPFDTSLKCFYITQIWRLDVPTILLYTYVYTFIYDIRIYIYMKICRNICIHIYIYVSYNLDMVNKTLMSFYYIWTTYFYHLSVMFWF